MDFKEELIRKAELINAQLENYIKKDECPEKILNSSVEYSLLARGKKNKTYTNNVYI